jgi:DNA-binding NarL/FixJ family response regulator
MPHDGPVHCAAPTAPLTERVMRGSGSQPVGHDAVLPRDDLIRVGIFLGPDRALTASALGIALNLEADLDVCAVAALGLGDDIRASVADVDVALIDDVSLAIRLREEHTGTRAVVLGAPRDADVRLASILAGAAACVSEMSSPAQLAGVIRRVAAGEAVYEQAVLLHLVQTAGLISSSRSQRTATLSEREIEVLAALATGASAQEVALQLMISTNTVRTHLRNIITKVEARSKLEAVIIAIREGRIELPPLTP